MNQLLEPSNMNPTFIFIDGSYFCFYRYYALLQWWKNAFPEEPLTNPYLNSIFIDKFNKTFVENLKQIPKKLKISKAIQPILIVGKDCKRENIWRNEIFSEYKANRVYDETFMGGPFFQMVYENKLFEAGGSKLILKHSKLEADDCIAISVKYLINEYPDCKIYIITSDRDYLQLNSSNVHLYNLSFKNIAENKNCTGNAKKDLEIKIIMGDSSDNIPSVFPKCGPKTALKCIEDVNFFNKKMAENPSYNIQYELNQKLINFDKIPNELVEEFMSIIKNNN
jgi:5'-3' exonuclease